jgi:hypothetical protein
MNLCEKAQINFLKKIYMKIDKTQLIDDMKLSGDIETSDLDNISEDELNLISKFAPIIASMVNINI